MSYSPSVAAAKNVPRSVVFVSPSSSETMRTLMRQLLTRYCFFTSMEPDTFESLFQSHVIEPPVTFESHPMCCILRDGDSTSHVNLSVRPLIVQSIYSTSCAVTVIPRVLRVLYVASTSVTATLYLPPSGDRTYHMPWWFRT